MNAEIGREYGMPSMMGLYDAAMGCGMIFKALTGGAVMDVAGVRAIFCYGVLAGLVGIGLFVVFARRPHALGAVRAL